MTNTGKEKEIVEVEGVNGRKSENMRELIRNGAAGLVARFKFLELKGVLDRPPGVPAAPPPAAPPPAGQAAPPPPPQ